MPRHQSILRCVRQADDAPCAGCYAHANGPGDSGAGSDARDIVDGNTVDTNPGVCSTNAVAHGATQVANVR